MLFSYPTFLFALFSISIPVIIHLFNFRRYKKYIFSDIRFLKEVQEETKSRQRLKEWLILLSRIFAITLLVLAFAQPFIPHRDGSQLTGSKAVSIFVDNSFSMGNEGSNGILLETAKNKARGIINAYGNDEKFQILNDDFEGKQQRLLSKNDALQSIDDMKLSAASKKLSSVVSRQKQAFENIPEFKRVSYVISDFQKNFTDIEKINNAQDVSLNFVPVQANVAHNLYLDSAWLLRPLTRLNAPVLLKVRVRNSGDEDLENIAITFKINAVQKALVNVNCAAQSFADAEISFTINSGGWQQAELSIIDHPITFDDKLFFTIPPSLPNNVLCINGDNENPYIKKVFEGDDSYLLSNSSENKIDYSVFGKKQLVILNEPRTLSSGLSSELKKYLENGGSLLIIPPAESKIEEINTFLKELNTITFGLVVKQNLKVDRLNTQEEIFNAVFQKIPLHMDLPSVSQYYETLKTSSTKGVSLMQLNNGLPFIYRTNYKKGQVFLFTTPLNEQWSNLPQHAVFVPLMLKLAMGASRHSRLYEVIDKDQWINTNLDWQGAEKTAHIWGNGTDMLADVKQQDGKNEVYIDHQIKKSGVYQLATKDQKNADFFFAMNYNRDESSTQTMDADELTKNIKAEILKGDAVVLQQKISQQLSGTLLWRVCLMLSLVFVLIEILLLKLL